MFYTQVIKDNLLTPRVMGDAIGLHPVMVILVVLIGAKLAGVSGVVFALPVAGLLNVIFDYYLEHRIANPEIMKSENSTNSFQRPES
jgi:predicted PurR-regulated permease PerM